ncbi:alpha,alpha-trehalose-phosphate synthase [UDP-forming] 1-like isoform X2 [Magnolia sinica]|uniref:alpha,alpha-trehalose-phosphate synthase [UDP-forming] 1-like isoform X2 n=1 Tax=Magnolia sinica TaxID=86752 RepID=UPI00265B49F9|nr:alpha,alpha-trehalose-phosphate synthase [UDP-forming] 1-like isoform X2 [Magnolia sinica]
MPGNKYNRNQAVPSTRLERLLKERELRKFNRTFQPTEEADLLEHELNSELERQREEDYLDAVTPARSIGEGCESDDGRPSKQRLLVVANRLPVSAVRRGEDSWSLEISAGGLVSALLGVKEFEAKWIGWAGVNVPDEVGQKALTVALAEKRCIPVFLDEEIVHQYYNGYCNNILWPLFHYLGLPQEDRLATTRSFQSQFDAYKKANQMFADVVNEHYEEGDVVWCHDYHLMFLPKCLKEHNSQMKVGWFLHTPFPSSEIHRTLPSRSELLRSVLAADLVGFHTYDYARHFVSACTRILGLEGTPEGVEDQGKLTRVAAFPIGIDSDRFIRALELPQVQAHIKELKERFAGRKVMLGVDRLDMIKGIPQKILAFEKFLEENPHWRDKVVLLQIAVPTRTDVPEYQKLTSQVHEIVGRINGRFGTLTAVPIHHLDRSLDFHALCALYAVTDVALVTSLRDGMNLVSYEFVACQDAKKGVLILSEFAGAAQSLGAGAILVNPWNITEVAFSIGYALDMPGDEREKRHRHNFMHVTTHTAQDWAETFVSELNDTILEAQLRTRQVPPLLPIRTAVDRYMQSKNRLLILGFNATLTEPVDTPGRRGGDQIKEMELKLHPDLKQSLAILCNDPKTTIVVLSGSDRTVLDDNFGDYDMWLAAENGMFLRLTRGEWMTTMPEHLSMDWVDSVKHVFEYFTERTPRSHFELRETSLVWNYKYADVEFGRIQARDMLQHLWTGPISNAAVDVVQGSRSVEVRSVGVTKGAAIDRILGEIVHSKCMVTPIDYVLCIGHFLGKDEDIYTFFEPELPAEPVAATRAKVADAVKPSSLDKRSSPRQSTSKSSSKASHGRANRNSAGSEKKTSTNSNHSSDSGWRSSQESIAWHEGSSVLDLKGENYFSCAVGRKRSNARYLLASSEEVVLFLKELAWASSSWSG